MPRLHLCPSPEQLLHHRQPALPCSIVQSCSPETGLSHQVQGGPGLQEELAHLGKPWQKSSRPSGKLKRFDVPLLRFARVYRSLQRTSGTVAVPGLPGATVSTVSFLPLPVVASQSRCVVDSTGLAGRRGREGSQGACRGIASLLVAPHALANRLMGVPLTNPSDSRSFAPESHSTKTRET